MDVITIGETMVQFTPNSDGHMRYAETFKKRFAGAESNVAIGLSKLNHEVGWISRLGNDEFGKSLLSFVKGEGVDVSQVTFDKEASTGLFFKEIRTNSETRVQYYRKNSAASKMTSSDLNEEYISKSKYLHITGITPVLSETCNKLIFDAIKIAKRNNVKVVFDPNLRKSLWNNDEEAKSLFYRIAELSDIVLPGVEEGKFLFGCYEPKQIGKKLLELGVDTVVIKMGARGSYILNDTIDKHILGNEVKSVKDPIGAGDAFATGFLSGLLDGLTLEESAVRGNLLGSIVVKVEGDVEGLPDRDELSIYNKLIDDVYR